MRWGIIGGGDVAQRSVVPGMALAKDMQLVAVMNRRLDNARAFAEKNKLDAAYDSLDAMLANPGIDAVYIATPNLLHADQAVAAARAGKHVLCDKPMALTVEDAQRMIDAAESHGVTLGVVFQNRYHPAHIEARKRVGEGVFGEIQHVSAQLCTGRPRGFWKGWRLDPSAAGSGSIVGQAVHPIDLLRHVIGSEVVEVSAMTDQRPPERPVDESSYALLRFASGAIATVVSGTILPRSSNDVVIYGSAARLHCRNTLGSQAPGSQQQLVLEGDDQLSALLDYSTSTSAQRFGAMIDDFNQCVRDGREPAISGRNGLQMVKIANALLESSRHGRAVRIN